MSPVAWVILLAVALPSLGFLVFLLLENSRVVVPPGRIGLLLIKGRATDTALPPGPHWVASLRRQQVVEYPSVELTYRAGDPATVETDLERAGPPLPVVLGDRAAATLRYTVRCSIALDDLKGVHQRFGTDGLWAVVRDTSERAVALALTTPGLGVDDVFGDARAALGDALAAAVTDALRPQGLHVTFFHLVDVDLHGTGDSIQDEVRARYDAELATAVAGLPIGSLRAYQEADAWRRLARGEHPVSVVLPAGGGAVDRSAPAPSGGGGT